MDLGLHVISLVTGLGLVAGLTINLTPTAGSPRSSWLSLHAAAPATVDPSRFMLNALLVPALDDDAMPLRWVDPRPQMNCGPDTEVHVDGKPIRPGAMVPDSPFELAWQMKDCRPFGAQGPRFDGAVRLTVFRENWGFSAMVEPTGLRVALGDDAIVPIKRGTVSLPQCIEAEAPDEPTAGADRSLTCRSSSIVASPSSRLRPATRP